MSSLLVPAPSIVRSGPGAEARSDEIVAVGVVMALTVGTFLLHLTQMHQSLFGDELWTFQQVSGRSFSSMMHAIQPPGENAPPLFFILAWEAARHGDPTIWIRLPSLIFGAATVPAIYFLGRETVGRLAAVIGAAAFAVSPFATYYGIEARPYATMALFVVLSGVALIRAVRTGHVGWWTLYALAAAAAAYSGYTAVFPLAVQAAWGLWACRDRLGKPVLANAAVVALYAPWLPHVGSKALEIIGVLYPFRLHNVLGDLVHVVAGYPYAPLHAIPTIPGLALVGVCAVAGGAALFMRRSPRPEPPDERGSLRLIVALALAAPVGVALYSLLATDIWDPRDLYASLPAALLVLGALVAAIPSPAIVLAIAAVLGTFTFGTVRALGPYARPPFRAAATYLDHTAAPRDPIILFPSFLNLDEDIPAQFHRPHLVVNGAPRRWPAAPPGGKAFAVFDGHITGRGRVPVPGAPGYVLAGARQYNGLLPFTILTYRPT